MLRSHSVLSGYSGPDNPYGDSVGSFEKSIFELFDKKGNKLFEKELGNRKIEQTWIFKNGTNVLYTNEYRGLGENIFRYQIYDKGGNLLNEITSTAGMGDWQIAEYKLTDAINITHFTMPPHADVGLFAAQISGDIFRIIKLDMDGKLSEMASYETGGLGVAFLKDSRTLFVFATRDIDKLAPSGRKSATQAVYFYKDFKLIWKTEIEAESFGMYIRSFSKTGKYLIVEYWKDIVMKGNAYGKFTERVKVINTVNGKILYDGNKSEGKVKKYDEELIAE